MVAEWCGGVDAGNEGEWVGTELKLEGAPDEFEFAGGQSVDRE